jgi:polar amino acid transport system substrate-binding protein
MHLDVESAKDNIPIWTYYNYPPFVINAEAEEGLFFELVDILNYYADGEYVFKPEIVPRKRLGDRLATGRQVIIPFVHLTFMG